jgi:hypothetical protein
MEHLRADRVSEKGKISKVTEVCGKRQDGKK